jgi:uncharacterized protein
MTAATMTTATEPDGAPRVAGLDILRGVAILGILFMNIQDMGGSMFASFGDPRHYGWTTGDQVAWWLREVLASGTARCMLEMLFGVGMVILTDRAADAAAASVRREGRLWRVGRWLFGPAAVLREYYWRNFVLFLFGIAHIFLLMWPGDILHTYGIAAMVAFLFRRLGPKTLLGLGLAMALLQLVGAGISIHMRQNTIAELSVVRAKLDAGKAITTSEAKKLNSDNNRRIERAKSQLEDKARVGREDRMRQPSTATAMTWFTSAWDNMFYIWGRSDDLGEATFLEPIFIWEAAGTMLIGAALYKWGIIQGRRSPRFYLFTMLIAYLIGIGCRTWVGYAVTRFNPAAGPSLAFATTEVARLLTTLGHIAAVYCLLATTAGQRLLKPFEAAGRTALTIYICQTIICLWILYPPFALALYGRQGWLSLMLTAVAVNAVLLVAANWYVRNYRTAPVEWLWRSIVARRALPIRKGTAADRPRALPQPA